MKYLTVLLCLLESILGLLDLLWPLVTLMLEGQTQWCPGRKFAGYIQKARDEIIRVMIEIGKEMQKKLQMANGGEEIRSKKYGNSKLKVAWLVVEEKKGMPVSWEAREISDCIKDLQDFGDKVLKSLDEKFQKSFPKLSQILHECFDFGVLMQRLTGRRSNSKQYPINKRKFASLPMGAFKRCVQFVEDLPHVKDTNSELHEQFFYTIFWQLKSTIIEVIWAHFSKFFRRYNACQKSWNTCYNLCCARAATSPPPCTMLCHRNINKPTCTSDTV